ncbi:Hypothetical predicted protein [Pelobates cultripes]|uniref:Uncharacterized protein n=1 Tax=Pelobates cultripes TaxID=61616 RepID=A0AAD1VV37_PELCU|nr:Hypothetical predicted protein [Pelobates cultripes]
MDRKARRRTGAFSAHAACWTILPAPVLLTALINPSPTASGRPVPPAEMGLKSQRVLAGACTDTRDIGAMLQRQSSHKMAAVPDQDTNSTCSEKVPEESTDPDALTPATKLDRSKLLLELKQMLAADMDLVRTELQAVVQASEEEILDVRQEVKGLKEMVLQLQSSHAILLTKLDIAKDRSCRANIKIRGVPDTISPAELPHYIRRLLTTLLPHAQDHPAMEENAGSNNRLLARGCSGLPLDTTKSFVGCAKLHPHETLSTSASQTIRGPRRDLLCSMPGTMQGLSPSYHGREEHRWQQPRQRMSRREIHTYVLSC